MELARSCDGEPDRSSSNSSISTPSPPPKPDPKTTGATERLSTPSSTSFLTSQQWFVSLTLSSDPPDSAATTTPPLPLPANAATAKSPSPSLTFQTSATLPSYRHIAFPARRPGALPPCKWASLPTVTGADWPVAFGEISSRAFRRRLAARWRRSESSGRRQRSRMEVVKDRT